MGLLSSLANIGGLVAAPFTGGASLTPMLIGAAAGAAKHFAVDKPKEERSRKLTADMMRMSPWSGIKPPDVKESSGLFGSMLQGGALGATAGSALASAAPGAVGGAAGAANAGAAPLAQGASIASSPLAGAGNLSPMAGASSNPWFNLKKPTYPYQSKI